MSLRDYLKKRNLKKSKEPSPKIQKKKEKGLRFVIQEHHARRLHYDLRLEVSGVLKSWAVPKGPSMDPAQKRLAIMVEDHPYDYQFFEGVIPEGYGKGEVIIWDKGFYNVDEKDSKESEKLLKQGLKKGEFHFTLHGERLQGTFTLVRLKGKENEWLLIKKKDLFVGSIEEKKSPISVDELPQKKMPHLVLPMLTTLIDEPFDSSDWIFEIKFDGFRAIAELNGVKVNLFSRTQKSFNLQFPKIVEALKQLNIQAIFDGEIVVLDNEGKPDFQSLQNYQKSENLALTYFIFDILFLDSHDLQKLPLLERKKILRKVLRNKKSPFLEYTDFIDGKGKEFFELCKKANIEGIIGKKKTSFYEPGKRVESWVKIKIHQSTEAIICGFTEPKGSRKGFGALILGVNKGGKLHFIGRVGGGFSEKEIQKVKERLLPLVISKSPFENPPIGKITWVKPKIVCEVIFGEWTKEGILRQPIFKGIREDKKIKEITLEKPKKIKSVESNEKKLILTHLDKLYWPKEKITKGKLIDFYRKMSPILLPYLIDRPESLKRFPNGIDEASFFQKNLSAHPDWIKTVKLQHENKVVNYLLIEDQDSLLYAANLGCIELHPFFSKVSSLQNPDFFVLDLDPMGPFKEVVEVARAIFEIAQELKMPAFCKTSGATGLHIYVPLNAKYSYTQAKNFAEVLAIVAQQRTKNISTLERMPKKRQKKVYIDFLQNNFGQTIAAPYSVRARKGAPVSTPLMWSEVKIGLDPNDYTIYNIEKRVKKIGDIFRPVLGKGVDIEKLLPKIEKLL